MYIQHFRLTESPFSIAPNPRYLYLSPQHREALAHLLYGIGVGGGFVVLTGEVGTGKTTLCRALLDQLPEDVDIALIFNPRLNSRELLASICDELHIPYAGPRASLKQLINALNQRLLEAYAQGRRVIVMIDEAQNLRFDVLEQVRLLTNLETNQAKLLQIILIGQPELNQILNRPNLRQLSQRVTARYHLNPLSRTEAGEYLRHRMTVVGGTPEVFTGPAMRVIHARAHGLPRLINLIADRALLGAYALGKTQVNGAMARRAARELMPATPVAPGWRLAALLGVLFAVTAGGFYAGALSNPIPWILARYKEAAESGQSLLADHRPPEPAVPALAQPKPPVSNAERSPETVAPEPGTLPSKAVAPPATAGSAAVPAVPAAEPPRPVMPLTEAAPVAASPQAEPSAAAETAMPAPAESIANPPSAVTEPPKPAASDPASAPVAAALVSEAPLLAPATMVPLTLPAGNAGNSPVVTDSSKPAVAVLDKEPAPMPMTSGTEPKPVAEAAPPLQPIQAFSDWIKAPQFARISALKSLLALWSVTMPETTPDPCVFAAAQGLRCESMPATWMQITKLNLPVVLEFVLPNREYRYAALAGQQEQQLAVANGAQTGLFTATEVLSMWSGQAVVIWKPPNSLSSKFWPGARSPVIAWVRERLGVPGQSGNESLYDDALMARVVEFQTSRGLQPDGIVGALTLLNLQAMGKTTGIPRLNTGPH